MYARTKDGGFCAETVGSSPVSIVGERQAGIYVPSSDSRHCARAMEPEGIVCYGGKRWNSFVDQSAGNVLDLLCCEILRRKVVPPGGPGGAATWGRMNICVSLQHSSGRKVMIVEHVRVSIRSFPTTYTNHTWCFYSSRYKAPTVLAARCFTCVSCA